MPHGRTLGLGIEVWRHPYDNGGKLTILDSSTELPPATGTEWVALYGFLGRLTSMELVDDWYPAITVLEDALDAIPSVGSKT
jgi:hypothetical protein